MKEKEKEITRRKPAIIKVLESYPNEWYCLLDSGDGRKLEKAGSYILIRPEAEAIWPPALPEKEWAAAHAEFVVTQEKNGGSLGKI